MAAVGCDLDGPVASSQQAASSPDLAVLSVGVGPRALPGGTLPVSITVRNSGNTTWKPGSVKLGYTGEAGWSGTTLALPATTKPNQTVTFSGTLGAPKQIGLYQLSWRAQDGGAAFGPIISATTEVTCSDGIFCNGDERYSNGKCVAGPPPCDDGAACTADSCDEAAGLCGRVPAGGCDSCAVKNCNPNCHGALCGDDGCGGSCGLCPDGQVCVDGGCAVADQPGTCADPLPLVPGAVPSAPLAPGLYVTSGDNTNGFDELVPPCDPIPAREQIYELVVTQTMGIDAQSFGIDTVLQIRAGSCAGSVVACNDDAAPPGNYGSHVFALLPPGTYLVAVDGFDSHAVGPFTLAVHLVAGCVPQCDGKFCGDDGCGGLCGTCADGELCSSASRCVASPCAPQCGGRQCGDDGCGGSCGSCQAGKACDEVTGACKNVAFCDHERPVCSPKCASTEYCGSDCDCHRVRDPRPDLIVDEGRLAGEMLFDTLDVSPSSCTLVEDCVDGTGLRKLLRFTVEATNQGSVTLTVPPPKLRPDLFQFSSCHGHYHFNGFASYALLDTAGNVVLTGKKLAYCMEDTEQVLEGPTVGCDKIYDCANQGIQAGWADIYGNSLDCQWLDITDVPPGDYFLQVGVNPNRAFEEASFDNNVTTVPVTIP